MTAPHTQCQPGCGEPSSLIERLRAPLWEHSAAMFCGPRLSQEETLADLNAAADRIEFLEATEANQILKLKHQVDQLTNALQKIADSATGQRSFGDIGVLALNIARAAVAIPLEDRS